MKVYFQPCRLHLLMLMNDLLACLTHSPRLSRNSSGSARHFPAFRSGTLGRAQSNNGSRDRPDFPAAPAAIFPISRLVVDPERFHDDSKEPMSRVGVGVIYIRGTLQQKLREAPRPSVRQQLLDQFYHPHHCKLE